MTAPPPGWSTNFDGTNQFGEPWYKYFLGLTTGVTYYMWELERGSHFYGAAIPLLHRTFKGYHHELAIFSVGGLLFVLNTDNPFFHVVTPGVTVEELIASMEAGFFPAEEVVCDAAQGVTGLWFNRMMRWERRKLKRNRCVELHERGGRVHPKFLVSTEL